MSWTDSQKKAIDARGNNFLVSAAAGSGKTSVLVERVQKLILEDRVDIDSMLIVTFTNAAAAEMKHRIYAALSGRLGEEKDPAEQKRLRGQLSALSRANISTFSSFALEIVHRYYHVIGLQPALGICDESREEILKREAMDELMEARYAAKDEAFRAFLDRYAKPDSDDAVRGMILSLHRILQSLPYPEEWLSILPEEGQTDRFLAFAADQAKSCVEMGIAYFEKASELLDGLPGLAAKNLEDLERLAQAREVLAQGDTEGALALLSLPYQRMTASKAEKPSWEEVKEEVSGLRGNGKEFLNAAKEDYLSITREEMEKEREMGLSSLQTLISLTEDFTGRYGAKKGLLGLMDFADIEHFALRILQDESVQREYREKFACIFVDEYQDSNTVQEELIRSVSRGNNVFMVGDVKQSIYKFRLAEPELFLRKAEDFGKGEGGELITLNSNFRSKASVIDLVNRVFSQLMTRASCGMDYTQDQRLEEGAPYAGEYIYPARFYLVDMAEDAAGRAQEDEEEAGADAPSVDEEIEELKASEAEALQAVRLIREYLGKTIHDGKEKNPAKQDRPLRFRDMAILMRAVRTDGEVFYKTLLENGIPVFLERSEGYFDTIEIQVFLNLLRLIDNRSQDIPLLSVLRCPVFGFDASDLAAVRIWAMKRGDTRAPYNRIFLQYCEEGPEGGLRDRCRSFAAKLDGWRRQAQYMPLGDFLWRLLDETGYASFAGAVPEGVQRLANLRSLAEKAQSFDEENAGGLYGFIRYIDAIAGKKLKVSVGQARVMSESEDAVRIMTIHKSKGLEFPFVLLAGLGKRRKGREDTHLAVFHKDLGAALRLVNPQTGLYCNPKSLDLILRRKSAEEMAEDIRVLYVALTRPKDILLMTAAVKNAQSKLQSARRLLPSDMQNASDYASVLLSILGENSLEIVPQSVLRGSKAQAHQQTEDLTRKLKDGFCVPDGALSEDLRREIASRLAFDSSAELSEQEKRKYSVSQIALLRRQKQALPRTLASGEDEPSDAGAVQASPDVPARLPVFLSEKKKMDASARGTAYHTVMEHLPFTWETYTPQEVASFMDGLQRGHILSEDERAAVDPARICAFFSSRVGMEARKAAREERLRKEAPFTMTSELDGRSVLVQGTIDCYFEQLGGWVLVDYKSNYIDRSRKEAEMERLRAEYIPQLALYREALEGITGKPVKKAVLYLFGIDEEVSIDDQQS